MSQQTMQYWSQHLAVIAAEGITTKAYAEREGLPVGALYYWRKRVKAGASDNAAAEPAKRKLVPVRIEPPGRPRAACTLTLAPGIHLELPQLPDPQWLASLMAATAVRGD